MDDLGKLPGIIGIVLVIAASAMKERLTSFLGAVIWKTGGLGGLPPV